MDRAVKGYMTFAGDMALLRHERFVKRVEDFCNTVELPILMNIRDTKDSRIVDSYGHVVAEYEHQS